MRLVEGVAEANVNTLVGVSDSTPPEESENCVLMVQMVLVRNEQPNDPMLTVISFLNVV